MHASRRCARLTLEPAVGVAAAVGVPLAVAGEGAGDGGEVVWMKRQRVPYGHVPL